jgi:transcriptional regulator with XRE-family HTH domain
MNKDEVTTLINEILDRVRQERVLSETGLAEHLNIDPSTLWRWRNGERLCKSTEILLPLAINHRQSA